MRADLVFYAKLIFDVNCTNLPLGLKKIKQAPLMKLALRDKVFNPYCV